MESTKLQKQLDRVIAWLKIKAVQLKPYSGEICITSGAIVTVYNLLNFSSGGGGGGKGSSASVYSSYYYYYSEERINMITIGVALLILGVFILRNRKKRV